MEKEITTVEELAEMIQRTMATKEDMESLATKEDLKELRGEMNAQFGEVDTRLDHLDDARVGRIEADIKELRGEIVYRHEFEDAVARSGDADDGVLATEDVLGRIQYLERKLGVESGV